MGSKNAGGQMSLELNFNDERCQASSLPRSHFSCCLELLTHNPRALDGGGFHSQWRGKSIYSGMAISPFPKVPVKCVLKNVLTSNIVFPAFNSQCSG